jgi:hypothetical protein
VQFVGDATVHNTSPADNARTRLRRVEDRRRKDDLEKIKFWEIGQEIKEPAVPETKRPQIYTFGPIQISVPSRTGAVR